MEPTLGSLKQVATLETNYSVLFKNKDLVGLQLLPIYMMSKRDGTFYKYPQNEMFRTSDDRRATEGPASEVRWKPTTDTFSVSDHAKRKFISDIMQANADQPVKPDRYANMRLTNELLLGLEINIAAQLLSSSVLTNYVDLSLAATTQFNDFNNSTPRSVFKTARLTMKFVKPNVAIMDDQTFETLRIHPDMLSAYQYVQGGVLTNQQIADIMGVEKLLVSGALKDTANSSFGSSNVTASYSRVWDKSIVFAYVDPTPALESVTLGWTCNWAMPGTQGLVQGFDGGTPLRVRRYRADDIGGGGDWIEVDTAYDIKIVSADCGYLIKNAIA